jgi:hypothetical protein
MYILPASFSLGLGLSVLHSHSVGSKMQPFGMTHFPVRWFVGKFPNCPGKPILLDKQLWIIMPIFEKKDN